MNIPPYINMEMKFSQLCFELYQNGIYINQEELHVNIELLKKKIAEIDLDLIKHMPPRYKQEKPLVGIYKKDGELKASAQTWIASGHPYSINGSIMERHKIEQPNLNSVTQLREYLESLGWVPSEDPDKWNYKTIKNRYGKLEKVKDHSGNYIRTTPKIPSEDEELSRLSVISKDFERISKRISYSHRLNTLLGYQKNTRSDGRIPMSINSCGCNTMRVRHAIVANIPREESFFGKEMRSLFQAPPGRILVGCDIDGLEACMLAHYLGDPGFIQFIQDNEFKYHKFFFKILAKAGLVDDTPDGYNQTKSIDFAFLYGGGDAKLGSLSTARGSAKALGAEIRRILMANVPGLEELQSRLLEQYRRYQGVIGLDNRIIPVRKESALINTACQSGGAIAAKAWTCKYRDEIKRKSLDSKHVIFYHDSNTEETTPIFANQVGEIMTHSLIWTAEYLKLKIPLSGTYTTGRTWGESH